MTIRTIGFNPLKITVDDVETPVIDEKYLDEDGNSQIISYIVVNGEKIAIQHRAEILEKLKSFKLDEAIAKVEEIRLKNVSEKALKSEIKQ